MRTAKVEDYWRRTYRRNYKFKISQLEFSNLRGLGSGSVSFDGAITAVCGLNGVGKSTILNALVGLINPEDARESSIINLKLEGSELFLTLEKDQQDVIKVSYKDGNSSFGSESTEELNTTWIDLSAYGPNLLSYFSSVKNLDEHLDTVDPYILNKKELSIISYILGRTYDSCTYYEIELDGVEIPYFKVAVNGLSYGTEYMGLGELSALYIFWCLNRASNDSVLIIDEPETYLSHNSQIALIDVIAKFCSEKSIWAIIATHSFGILNRIPPEHVKLITRVGNDIRFSTYDNQQAYFQALGMPKRESGVILVEDRAAREFGKLWIRKFFPLLTNEFEFKDVGSVDEIKKWLNFPKVGSWLNIIGLFDGDERGLKQEYNWPYTFLPGNFAPEKVLRESALKHLDELGNKLNRDISDIHLILSTIDGLDHHDWLEEFQKKSGLEYNQLIKVLFDIFLIDNEEIAKDSFDQFFSIIQSS